MIMLYVDGVFVYYLVETTASIEASGLIRLTNAENKFKFHRVIYGASIAGSMPRPEHLAL